jgi:hypothetical protein
MVNSISQICLAPRSIERLAFYENMDTIKINTTFITVQDTVDKILAIIS